MKIAVADDDPSVVTLLPEHLNGWGHEVVGVYDGEALVRQAVEDHPDLIISDLEMPGGRGEAAQAMVEMYPPIRDMQFIVITGTPRQDLYSIGLSQNTIVLTKPVSLGELDAAVGKIEARRNNP